MEGLTGRQKQILDFITDFASDSGNTPTIREIAGKFRISIGPAQKHVKALIRKGFVRHRPKISRGIDIISRKSVSSIPLLGRVPAGVPLSPFENVEDYIPLNKSVAGSGNCFALKVIGDSMTGAGIFDGDIVAVKQQATAENNDIVVAMVEGEATVKRLRKKNREAYLEPANPKYKPIYSKEITILGKVIYLMRNYKKN